MRKYLHIDLAEQSIRTGKMAGEQLAVAGRAFIAKTLLEQNVATVDALSPENPLIFSAGPFAGTNFSNGNRLSVGCKSPLTGGIKEANSGGTFAFALGQLEIAGFTLYGASADWVVIFIPKDGPVRFDSAAEFMGNGNMATARALHEAYGDKVSVALCGPIGERLGLMAGIAFSDVENRPARFAARGGAGAVMGAKKVKAIVVEKDRMPPMHDRRKVMTNIKSYGRMLGESVPVQNLSKFGTAMVADYTNTVGGLPVRNFSSGQMVARGQGPLKAGGTYIHDLNEKRGGDVSHACMPGCLIKCSNVYVDSNGEEIVSPLEYETIGLMGTNCGLDDPDDIARLNYLANDLGIDSIELGATLGVLMEAGEAEFGDRDFMEQAINDIAEGNERGLILMQGTARVGEHYKVARVPVIKKQAISAYDPRIIEVTGISMMVTAQGADHTTGNIPSYECAGKSVEQLAEASYGAQVNSALADSVGLCVFGRSVTDENLQLIADAINGAFDAHVTPAFLIDMARQALRDEHAFNVAAGFTEENDELPGFFSSEALPPTGKTGRLHANEVNRYMRALESAPEMSR